MASDCSLAEARSIGNKSALVNGLWPRALRVLFRLEDTDSRVQGALGERTNYSWITRDMFNSRPDDFSARQRERGVRLAAIFAMAFPFDLGPQRARRDVSTTPTKSRRSGQRPGRDSLGSPAV